MVGATWVHAVLRPGSRERISSVIGGHGASDETIYVCTIFDVYIYIYIRVDYSTAIRTFDYGDISWTYAFSDSTITPR